MGERDMRRKFLVSSEKASGCGQSAASAKGGAPGRKRHIAADTDGRWLMINLTTADVREPAGAEAVVSAFLQRWPWLKLLFADGAHNRRRLPDLAAYKGFNLTVVCRLPDTNGL